MYLIETIGLEYRHPRMNTALKTLKIGVLSRSPILNGKNSDIRKKVCTKKGFTVLFVVTKISKHSLLHFTSMLTLPNTPRYFPSSKFTQRENPKQGQRTGLHLQDHKEQ